MNKGPKFTPANKYIFDPKAYAWNLPSGHTCPLALKCLAKADRKTGKITDGEEQEYKCYSAVYERYPSVRKRVWENFEAVKKKSPEEVAKVLSSCFPVKAKRVRIHTSGDFFSQDYFDGWLMFIRQNKDCHFWAFTKSLWYWVKRKDQIPANLVLTASVGGKQDLLIGKHDLKYAKVVYSRTEAAECNLRIDKDDRLAAYGAESFALLENFKAKK
tara:strand:+ start:1358 stop:2002 length:645 start_codon:yes stop_codon:yes gene_type:complete